jgi:hypothetical protein
LDLVLAWLGLEELSINPSVLCKLFEILFKERNCSKLVEKWENFCLELLLLRDETIGDPHPPLLLIFAFEKLHPDHFVLDLASRELQILVNQVHTIVRIHAHCFLKLTLWVNSDFLEVRLA